MDENMRVEDTYQIADSTRQRSKRNDFKDRPIADGAVPAVHCCGRIQSNQERANNALWDFSAPCSRAYEVLLTPIIASNTHGI